MGALSTSAWANLRMVRCWAGQWGLYSHKKRRDQAGHIINGKKKVKALAAQLCPTLHNSMDCSPPGSSVHGVLQTRILEWVAISFSKRSSVLTTSFNFNYLLKAVTLSVRTAAHEFWRGHNSVRNNK